MAYVAYCDDCDGMVAACVDDPARRRGKDGSAATVAGWLRDGDRVERVTCQFVRENLTGCTATCGCKWCIKKRATAERADQIDLAAGGPR
jgi:hypothetical protein